MAEPHAGRERVAGTGNAAGELTRVRARRRRQAVGDPAAQGVLLQLLPAQVLQLAGAGRPPERAQAGAQRRQALLPRAADDRGAAAAGARRAHALPQGQPGLGGADQDGGEVPRGRRGLGDDRLRGGAELGVAGELQTENTTLRA